MGRTYLFYKIAKEIWDSVQEMYSDLKNSSQCFELKLAISTTKQDMISVIEYFNILVKLWHEMDMFILSVGNVQLIVTNTIRW